MRLKRYRNLEKVYLTLPDSTPFNPNIRQDYNPALEPTLVAEHDGLETDAGAPCFLFESFGGGAHRSNTFRAEVTLSDAMEVIKLLAIGGDEEASGVWAAIQMVQAFKTMPVECREQILAAISPLLAASA